jgi:dihydrofolate reductase
MTKRTNDTGSTRLILLMGISVDGFVAAPDGSQPWLGGPREDPAATRWKLGTIQGADAHLMGRKTYGDMASHWPSSQSAYATPMNDIPKVVFSTTLERAGWAETRIAAGDLGEEIAAIKARPGGYVVAYGGATFARALIRGGHVDEYRLNVQPFALRDRHADLHRAHRAVEARPRRRAALRQRQRRSRLRAGRLADHSGAAWQRPSAELAVEVLHDDAEVGDHLAGCLHGLAVQLPQGDLVARASASRARRSIEGSSRCRSGRS